MNPPVRIAHRGGGSLAPENSLEGIGKSLSYGIEMIEVDVRRSADGALVLSHDDALHTSRASVRGSTLAELRSSDPHVATLDEAFDLVRGKARLNLDIKDGAVAEALLDRIRAHDALDGVIVSCLEPACLVRVAALEPGVARFFSYPPDYGGASSKRWLTPVVNGVVAGMRATLPLRLAKMVRPLPGTSVTIYQKLITRRLVDTAHRMGLEIYTWTVDDAAEMRRLCALGIDGITSNRPDLLAALPAAAPMGALA